MDISSRMRRLWDGARHLPPGGVITVTTGFLLHLSLGCMYSFGNLTTYLTSYLHVRLGLSVDYSDTQWISTAFGMVKGPGVLLGGMACRRFGARLTLLVGSLFVSVGMALCCIAVQTSFATTILAYSVLGGFGNGLAYTTPMLIGYMWFPRHRGAVSGVVVGGFGLGSIIFTSVQTAYLNPDNLSPDDDGFFHDDALLDRVPSLFLVQAAICAGLQLCGILGVRPPPKPESQETRSGHTETEEQTSASEEAGEDTDKLQSVTLAGDDESVDEDPKAWRRYVFTTQTLQLTLVLIMNANGMLPVNSFWKAFGQTFIHDDHYLSMVGSGSSVFNMGGRLVWGLMCDATGYKPTMVAITGLLAAFLFTFPLTSVVGQGMYLVWVWALYFCMSGTYSVIVTGTAATFGVQHAGHIYGVIFLVSAFTTLPMTYAYEAMMDRWDDYSDTFLLGGCCVCIGLAATLTFRPRRRAGDKPLQDNV